MSVNELKACREAFEAWFLPRWGSSVLLMVDDFGHYDEQIAEEAWQAWQASRSTQSENALEVHRWLDNIERMNGAVDSFESIKKSVAYARQALAQGVGNALSEDESNADAQHLAEHGDSRERAFWKWLPLAYRNGDYGQGFKFTKWNMSVAYQAGWDEALRAAEQGA